MKSINTLLSVLFLIACKGICAQESIKVLVKGVEPESSIIIGGDSTHVIDEKEIYVNVPNTGDIRYLEYFKKGYLKEKILTTGRSHLSKPIKVEPLVKLPEIEKVEKTIILNSIDYSNFILTINKTNSFHDFLQKAPSKKSVFRSKRYILDRAEEIEYSLINFFNTHELSQDPSKNGFSIGRNNVHLEIELETFNVYSYKDKEEICLANIRLNFFDIDMSPLGSYLDSCEVVNLDMIGANNIVDCLEKVFCRFMESDLRQSILRVEEVGSEVFSEDSIRLILGESIESARDSRKGIVTVITESGHGSGCQISTDGLIVTNYHVVNGHESVVIKTFSDGELSGKVYLIDPLSDLALIKVDTVFKHVLKLNTDFQLINARVGNEVYAVGAPLDVILSHSVSSGIISSYLNINELNYIQFDATVNSGNSGGGLVDSNGELIGVVNAKAVNIDIEGISFAIPIETILSVFNLYYDE